MHMDIEAICKKHPERREIFKLAELIDNAGRPYFFNFFEDLRPTPFDHDGGDSETDIDWSRYKFLIEVGNPVGYGLAQMSVCFNQKGDKTLLELLDMRRAEKLEKPTAMDGDLTRDLTAEAAMKLIEKFFEEQ